jgi:hypothetical protein
MLLALLAAAAQAAAQETVPPSPAAKPAAAAAAGDASSPIFTARHGDSIPQPATDADGMTRTVSPGIAAALAEGMPKYSPPTPTPAATAEPQDMRDIDKPKNDIPRLPKYVVHELRPPVFRVRDLYTDAGLVALSLKAHPGLRIGNIFGLNSGVAYQMYLDDEKQANVADLTDTAHAMALGGDAAEGRYILQATQDTYMQPGTDMTWTGPGAGGGFSGGGGK